MEQMIGIVSGMGPGAGLDLARKVIEQTEARRDQEHLAMTLVSVSEHIGNRTDFILGRDVNNPAEGIVYALEKLHGAGATVIGIPCNTSHADCIFDVVRARAERLVPKVQLLSMVDEVISHISHHHSGVRKVGVLATSGTVAAGVYSGALERNGCIPVELDSDLQAQLNEAIHDENFGLKATTERASARAVGVLERSVTSLLERGAEIGVLACTELPMAISGVANPGLPLLDANLLLARSLIRVVNPDRLKALSAAG